MSLFLPEDSPPTCVLDSSHSHLLENIAQAMLPYSSSVINCPSLQIISVVKIIQDSVKRALEPPDRKDYVHYFLVAAVINYPKFSV